MGVLGFGLGNPFPLTIGGGDSTLDTVHQSLLDAYAPGWDTNDTGGKTADALAQALAITFVWVANGRLTNQSVPSKMLESLTTWEQSTRLRPADGSTASSRRAAVAAKLRGFAGNTLSDIDGACSALLGANYLGIVLPAPADIYAYWPGVYPGPPGFEWSTNRCHIYIHVTKWALTDIQFRTFTDLL